MVIAVDFDGTICEEQYPDIGEPKQKVIEYLKHQRQQGVSLILWTCRADKYLEEALCWCREQGLVFDAVNQNLPEHIAKYNNDTRKVFADVYLDDRNITIKEIF